MAKSIILVVNFLISGAFCIIFFRFYGKKDEEAAQNRKKVIVLIFTIWIFLFAVIYVINQFIL